jgi:hypothetical protein
MADSLLPMHLMKNMTEAAFYFVRGLLKIGTAYALRAVVKMEAIK